MRKQTSVALKSLYRFCEVQPSQCRTGCRSWRLQAAVEAEGADGPLGAAADAVDEAAAAGVEMGADEGAVVDGRCCRSDGLCWLSLAWLGRRLTCVMRLSGMSDVELEAKSL